MGVKVNWYSQKGSRTEDNRDYCGIGLRSGAMLCIVLDGSTSGPNGGELAQQIAHELIDWFVNANADTSAQVIVKAMQNIHDTLSRQFPFDSASYIIVLIQDENPLRILHAGDCLFGKNEKKHNQIRWLTKPHTLANATNNMSVISLADSPARHRLTRSFRPKEFVTPESSEIKIQNGDSFIVATDGFWAELNSEEQSEFIEVGKVSMMGEGDDQSILRILILSDQVDSDIPTDKNALDNCYVKIA